MATITRGDTSRIGELEPLWHALREHHGSVTEHWGPLRDPQESWRRRRADHEAILAEGGVLFLAEEERRLVGFAICEREEGRSPTWEWPPDFLAIVDLVVLPEHRGEGIGDALIEAAEAEARKLGVAALDLNMAATNESARRFYERHGFRTDLVTMRKPL